MKIFKTKDGNFLDRFPQEVKTDKNGKLRLEYFVKGKGYKKTVKFEEIADIEFKNVSWFEVAKITDKYGLNVGAEFAELKTAGIVARQRARGHCAIYRTIKDIIPENFNEDFFDCLNCTYTVACMGVDDFDIGTTDDNLAVIDPEYDSLECTYKGKQISLDDYVTEKYGKEYSEIIERLIHKLCMQPGSKDNE